VNENALLNTIENQTVKEQPWDYCISVRTRNGGIILFAGERGVLPGVVQAPPAW